MGVLAPNHSWNGLTRPARINDNLSPTAAGSRSSAAVRTPSLGPWWSSEHGPGRSATSPGRPGGSAEALAGDGDVIRAPERRDRGEEAGRSPAESPGELGRRLARQGPGSPAGASGHRAPAGTGRRRSEVVSQPSFAEWGCEGGGPTWDRTWNSVKTPPPPLLAASF